ncbi:MAG: deoxyribonuclease IV [Candidatus Fermentithermobacillus carboniphilus]|uniref:Probable endonuclease 4 n=1 Tax=Candidatus Fermentithermobacillus carboniphilus TaxID=3085328 RepID=A0AAT9LD77_9FIRM|nr:MAG: deoxyribonuclease IV [Candidatus Fermentithermobacillus carboniphilus]
MRLGIHVSIQGGMVRMAETAVELGCETVQIFSRSPRGGKAKALDPHDVVRMREIFQRHDIYPLVVHVPYFLNLASSDHEKRAYSVEVMVEDLKRTETLGGRYLVTHIGHKDRDEVPDSPDALARVLESLEEILSRYSGPVKILLENTAGQGQEIGSRFESIAALLANLPRARVGTCFDTCHAFAQGYDLSEPSAVEKVLKQFDAIIGLNTLGAIHLNDSKGDFGSRIDRHQHIGQGKIGLEGFRALINSPLLPPDIPGILETPVDSPDDDKKNVETVKRLRTV